MNNNSNNRDRVIRIVISNQRRNEVQQERVNHIDNDLDMQKAIKQKKNIQLYLYYNIKFKKHF